ncbi:amidohydrolase family protein [Sulfurimonas sp.]|uniref:amidohydrolase family protein n=1 Tax=Sulfurimonas sp. TaxID=2022749 RepID=UPI002612870C|nr:amidohydrolase family protein [Sulfurimonas sp.]MCW8895460.1 amidohydrolase [Sulfurimonas sp.]
MQTVDIHSHLLNSEVSFNRFYDKLAIKFFGKKMGFDAKALIENPYETYTNSFTKMIRDSKYLSKTVLFGVDARVDDKGHVIHKDITVCATNEELLKLYEKNKDIIIPFFSINPMQPDALDLIDKYTELGFKGAKFLQNYWGVNTKEKRYRAYFEKLKDKDIPLIVHIGSESSVHSFTECETIDMLDHPLEIGVNVIAAHMALSYEPMKILKALSSNPKNFNSEYFKLLEMLQTHDNLYADISALLTPVRAKVLRHLSEQENIHNKLLFGTDYPVPFSTVLNSYDLAYKKRFELSDIENPFDRYTQTMLEYFPEDNPIYSNYKKILL